MLCNRCHDDIIGDGWDDDCWDGEEVDSRPEYGPRTRLHQELINRMLDTFEPKFRFKEFNEVKEAMKIGDTIEYRI